MSPTDTSSKVQRPKSLTSLCNASGFSDKKVFRRGENKNPKMAKLILLLCSILITLTNANCQNTKQDPQPKEWPHQFHSILVINNTVTTELQVVDLWYDWPNGRNLNLIQHQLGKHLYDVEWNNGTSYYYTLGGPSDGGTECRTVSFEVGILRPNWLDGATYLGQRFVDKFLCNVWEKADFLTYYEDVDTQRPVYWLFYTGRAVHVMTFEVGAVLEDSRWQAPEYCFNKKEKQHVQHEHEHKHFFLRDSMPLAFI